MFDSNIQLDCLSRRRGTFLPKLFLSKLKRSYDWTAEGLSFYIDFGLCRRLSWVIGNRFIQAYGCFLSLPGIRDLSKCPGRSYVNYGSSGASPKSGIIIIIRKARIYTRILPVSLVPLVSHLARNRRLDRFFGITRFIQPRTETSDRTDRDKVARGVQKCIIIFSSIILFPISRAYGPVLASIAQKV